MIGLLFLLIAETVEAQIKTFLHLKDIESPREGKYIQVVDQSTQDTIRIWAQHTTKYEEPEFPRSRIQQADKVVWCYPQRHPHPKHMFAEARGMIYSVRYHGIVYFYTEKTASRSEYFPKSDADGVR